MSPRSGVPEGSPIEEWVTKRIEADTRYELHRAVEEMIAQIDRLYPRPPGPEQS